MAMSAHMIFIIFSCPFVEGFSLFSLCFC